MKATKDLGEKIIQEYLNEKFMDEYLVPGIKLVVEDIVRDEIRKQLMEKLYPPCPRQKIEITEEIIPEIEVQGGFYVKLYHLEDHIGTIDGRGIRLGYPDIYGYEITGAHDWRIYKYV